MIISKKYDALRERARLLGDVFSLLLQREALLERRYSSSQPRAPAGQPNGGQWVSDGGSEVGDDAEIQLVGGLDGVDPSTNIGQFISDHCLGKVHREMPGQFYDMTIGEMLALHKAGDQAAKTCYKLLGRGEYRK